MLVFRNDLSLLLQLLIDTFKFELELSVIAGEPIEGCTLISEPFVVLLLVEPLFSQEAVIHFLQRLLQLIHFIRVLALQKLELLK
jgi:hypothetical protein